MCYQQLTCTARRGPVCADEITLDSDKGSVHKSGFRVDRSERFYQIDRLLKDRHVVSMTTFLTELEVSPATIKRDLEYLRSRFEAPIEWDPKRGGYCYAEPPRGQPRFELPGLWLGADEIQALLLMEDLLAQLQPGLLRQHLAPTSRTS